MIYCSRSTCNFVHMHKCEAESDVMQTQCCSWLQSSLDSILSVHLELTLLKYTGHVCRVVYETMCLYRTEEHLLLSLLAGMQGLIEHASQGVR